MDNTNVCQMEVQNRTLITGLTAPPDFTDVPENLISKKFLEPSSSSFFSLTLATVNSVGKMSEEITKKRKTIRDQRTFDFEMPTCPLRQFKPIISALPTHKSLKWENVRVPAYFVHSLLNSHSYKIETCTARSDERFFRFSENNSLIEMDVICSDTFCDNGKIAILSTFHVPTNIAGVILALVFYYYASNEYYSIEYPLSAEPCDRNVNKYFEQLKAVHNECFVYKNKNYMFKF